MPSPYSPAKSRNPAAEWSGLSPGCKRPARRVTNAMLLAAGYAVADLADISAPGAPLLPPVAGLRETSVNGAVAVARAAEAEGVASVPPTADPTAQIKTLTWEPRYCPVRSA